MQESNQKRILIVDDNPEIHNDFKRTLKKQSDDKLANVQEILFSKGPTKKRALASLPDLIIDSAFQGKEAAELVKTAFANNQPYCLAFVDIRMPPGWDGINTIKEIWKIDPELQIVICTAYSDYSWQDMSAELRGSENFLILKKPFDAAEVRQLVASLTKKWEYKRRITNKVENLEALVSERTEALRHSLELAEDANQLKNEFLSNVSQELRSPLNAIVGFTELMYHDKVDQKNIKEYYGDILSSAKNLLQMINDIVDMSLLETGTIDIQPEVVNLHLIIDEIKDMFRPAIEAKNIKCNFVIDPALTHVMTDPTKLKQVIHHYLSNAVKFTTNAGKIEIRASQFGNDQFRIDVIDTGIGIREQDIKKLFIPFKQLDMGLGKKYHGTGLGLALSRRIIEYQGGKVGVTSNFGKGSTFYFTLPLKS